MPSNSFQLEDEEGDCRGRRRDAIVGDTGNLPPPLGWTRLISLAPFQVKIAILLKSGFAGMLLYAVIEKRTLKKV